MTFKELISEGVSKEGTKLANEINKKYSKYNVKFYAPENNSTFIMHVASDKSDMDKIADVLEDEYEVERKYTGSVNAIRIYY